MNRATLMWIGAVVIGLLAVQRTESQQSGRVARLAREPYLSVVDFGANGKDDRWDSDAIQRAIDSLPKHTLPDGRNVVGGVVVLPAGRYLLNKPLRIFGGVTLRGEGAGTVLYMPGNDPAQPAILLLSQFGHRHAIWMTVEDLCIHTEKSAAIQVDSTSVGVVQCRLENLFISPGACAIDLDPGLAQKVYTQNSIIRNIVVHKYGGPALTLWGNANHIEAINTEGGTRDGFTAEPAIVTVSGGWNDISSCIIEGNNHPAVAYHISGDFTWSHNWGELNPAKDGIAYIFKDVETGQIDYLHHVIPQHRAKFINCEAILIRSLNINGDWTSLSPNLELDEKSNLRIDQISARMDAGMLDDPRISIGSIYNKAGKYRVDLPLRPNPISVMPAANARGTGEWRAGWQTPKGLIKGSMQIDDHQGSTSRRMRVEISENPKKQQLWIEVPLPVTDELIGRKCIATWRIDGTPQSLVLHSGQELREFPSRAMNSLTANPLPAPLKKGDKLVFILPPEPGEYFISDVAIYPP